MTSEWVFHLQVRMPQGRVSGTGTEVGESAQGGPGTFLDILVSASLVLGGHALDEP